MPKIGLTSETKLKTRNQYTTVDAEISLKVDGTELPNMSVLGFALERAVELIQKEITESYKEVPTRDGTTPVAKPYEHKVEAEVTP